MGAWGRRTKHKRTWSGGSCAKISNMNCQVSTSETVPYELSGAPNQSTEGVMKTLLGGGSSSHTWMTCKPRESPKLASVHPSGRMGVEQEERVQKGFPSFLCIRACLYTPAWYRKNTNWPPHTRPRPHTINQYHLDVTIRRGCRTQALTLGA